MNTRKTNIPTVKIILVGEYNTPHLIIQIGNRKTAAHTESYSTRSNAKRAQLTWYKIFTRQIGYDVVREDNTEKS